MNYIHVLFLCNSNGCGLHILDIPLDKSEMASSNQSQFLSFYKLHESCGMKDRCGLQADITQAFLRDNRGMRANGRRIMKSGRTIREQRHSNEKIWVGLEIRTFGNLANKVYDHYTKMYERCLAGIILYISLIKNCQGFNVEVAAPKSFSGSSGEYFGYSVALHRANDTYW